VVSAEVVGHTRLEQPILVVVVAPEVQVL